MGTVAVVELILLPWEEKRSCLFVCCSFSFLVSAPYKYIDDASIKQFMPDCPYWRRLRTTPWTKTFRRSWDDDGVVGNKVYPSYLLLFDRRFLAIGDAMGSLHDMPILSLGAGTQNHLLSHTDQ